MKWFSAVKGYGFIGVADGTGDVFLPGDAVAREEWARLRPGQAVTFEVEIRRGHRSAVRLRVA